MIRIRVKVILSIIIFLASVSSLPCLAEETKELTLEKSIEIAFERNRQILAAKERLGIAKGELIVARAGFLPALSLGANYLRLGEGQKISVGGGSEVVVRGQDTYTATATIEQPIFTWGRIKNSYRQASSNQRISEEDYRKERNLLRFKVTESFYNLILAGELLNLSRESYAQMERHLQQVEKRYEDGLASKFDLLRARVELANLKPELIRSRNGLTLAENRFKSLLGFLSQREVRLRGELKYEPTEIELSQAIKEALKNRPEVISLKEQENIALAQARLASASNKPLLSAIYNYQFQRPYHWKEEWGKEWNAMVVLEFPIFSGFSTRGKVLQSLSQLREVKYDLEDKNEEIELEVRETYLSLRQEEETIISQRENVTQAEEAMSIAEKRYTSGLITNLEFMDTQLAVTQAKTAHLQALANYLIAKAKLIEAMGR
ncbi:TolC family protein [bacterium]|nr:TolC family protein [bacterium]NIN91995.1 TolC family protein [bacterium]NIO18211.1 TolC family protein [bacterium]NIO73185.1 TolC family protein [bacterium]